MKGGLSSLCWEFTTTKVTSSFFEYNTHGAMTHFSQRSFVRSTRYPGMTVVKYYVLIIAQEQVSLCTTNNHLLFTAE